MGKKKRIQKQSKAKQSKAKDNPSNLIHFENHVKNYASLNTIWSSAKQ